MFAHVSHSHRGFSPVIELGHLISLTVLTVWSRPTVRARKKTVETVSGFGVSFDTGLKPRCE